MERAPCSRGGEGTKPKTRRFKICAAGWWMVFALCVATVACADDPADAAQPEPAAHNEQLLEQMSVLLKKWMLKKAVLGQEQKLSKPDASLIERLNAEESELRNEYFTLRSRLLKLKPSDSTEPGTPDIAGNWQINSSFNPNFPNQFVQFRLADTNWYLLFEKFPWVLRLDWHPEKQEFRCEMPHDSGRLLPYRISYSAQGNKINFVPMIDETVQKKLAAEVGVPESSVALLERRFTQVLSRPIVDRVQGGDFLIVETKDGLDAYSEVTGTWDRIQVAMPKDGFPRLISFTCGLHFATVVIDDQLLGYSSSAGRWARLTIPPEFVGQVGATHSQNLTTVTIGDKTYALSPKTGRWMSQDGKPTADDDAQFKVFPLKHGTPTLFRRMLLAFFPEANIQIDPRTNSLVVATADDNDLGEIQAVLTRLDVPPESENAEAASVDTPQGEILVFVASWNTPSQEMRSIAKALQRKGVRLQLVDIDQKQELTKTYHVRSVPTVIAVDDAGDEIRRHTGRMTREELLGFLKPGSPSWRTTASTLDTTSIAGRRERTHPRLDSPAAQRLADEIARHEAEAVELAKQIRNRSDQLGKNHPEQTAARQQLQNALAAALDLKFQLEALQLEDLRGRLSQLEQQIGQRKALKQKILDRRVEELIEGDATRWDGEAGTKEDAAMQQGAGVAPSELADSPKYSPNVTQVRFMGPKKMKICYSVENANSIDFVAPVTVPFAHAEPSKIKRHELVFTCDEWKSPLFATLDIYPSQKQTDAYLTHSKVPIKITDHEIGMIGYGKPITQVLYLPDAKYQELAMASVEKRVTTRFDDDVDLVEEAEAHGTVLAVLRLADSKDKLAAEPAFPMPTSAREREDFDKPFSTVSTPDGTNKAAVPSPNTTDDKLAFPALSYEALVSKLDAVSQKADDSRERQAVHDEFRAILRDLELQAESAQVAVEQAQAEFDRAAALSAAKVLHPQEKDTAERSLKQAKLAQARLDNRLALYRKAGEEFKVLPPKLSPIIPTDESPGDDLATAQTLSWERLGLKMRPINDAEQKLTEPQYRGGLLVTQVKAQSPAAVAGFRENDILVGLGQWETVMPQNVTFVLAQTKGDRNLRFVLIRDAKTLHGTLLMRDAE